MDSCKRKKKEKLYFYCLLIILPPPPPPSFIFLSLRGSALCSPTSASVCAMLPERPPWMKGEMLFAVCVTALTWTGAKQESCLDHSALSFLLSFFRSSPLKKRTFPSLNRCPSVCILHVNTNKMECVANSQMGSKPTTVKRLRLIWFSPRFRWEARPEPGSWHSVCESGPTAERQRRQWGRFSLDS